jgi:hypothetical protein
MMAWSFIVAVVEALKAHAGVVDALGGTARVYNITAPATATLPYIVVGGTTGNDASTFQHVRDHMTTQVDIYSGWMDEHEVLTIFEQAKDALHRRPLDVGGDAPMTGRLNLLTTAVDYGEGSMVGGGSTGRRTMRAIARYRGTA